MNKAIFLMMFSYKLLASCTEYPGMTSCKNETINSISKVGLVKMVSTNINGLLKIQGKLDAEDCNFSGIEVHGISNIKNSKIASTSNFYGMLSAVESSFNATLNIHGNNSLIENSASKDINIHSTDKATIKISGSQINGDISFIGNSGIVICNACHITGKIKNGTLKK